MLGPGVLGRCLTVSSQHFQSRRRGCRGIRIAKARANALWHWACLTERPGACCKLQKLVFPIKNTKKAYTTTAPAGAVGPGSSERAQPPAPRSKASRSPARPVPGPNHPTLASSPFRSCHVPTPARSRPGPSPIPYPSRSSPAPAPSPYPKVSGLALSRPLSLLVPSKSWLPWSRDGPVATSRSKAGFAQHSSRSRPNPIPGSPVSVTIPFWCRSDIAPAPPQPRLGPNPLHPQPGPDHRLESNQGDN